MLGNASGPFAARMSPILARVPATSVEKMLPYRLSSRWWLSWYASCAKTGLP
jgi:hypothetical protein